MRQLFPSSADVVVRWIIGGVVCAPFLVWGILHVASGSPYATGESHSPAQPVPFSHEHHVGEMGLDCRFCHATVETSRYAGAPAVHTCMTCHSQLWTGASILQPVRDAAASNQPLNWARVHHLPDFVYFDHSVHVNNGVGCGECHGEVARMQMTRQDKPLTMQWCLDCHRDPGPRLRPKEAITDTAPRPPNSPDTSQALMRAYHVNANSLTECSTCHR
jgi:hypothetical protein